MKAQFDHVLMSSFYLWFDDKITRVAEGYFDTSPQRFDFVVRGGGDDGLGIPEELDAYYCQDRQLVNNGLNEPTGVTIDGDSVEQNDSTYGLLIDHNEGRILVDSVANGGEDLSGSEILGYFKRKEVNCYMTDKTEEEILIHSDFKFYDDGETFLKTKGKLKREKYTLPAAFLTMNTSENKPFAMGGVDDTKVNLRVVVIAEDNYVIDTMNSMFRDLARTCIKMVDYEDFPLGEFSHVKSLPYNYPDFISGISSSYEAAFIERVRSSKLRVKLNGKLPKNAQVGFIDFDLSCIRTPRS